MARHPSGDPRIRAIRAMVAGMSRRAAARRYGLGVARAARQTDVHRRTDRPAPKTRGGNRRSRRIGVFDRICSTRAGVATDTVKPAFAICVAPPPARSKRGTCARQSTRRAARIE